MAQFITKKRKRDTKKLETHLEDLEAEKVKLEFLRDCRPLYDALTAHIARGLPPHDVLEIRKALLYLTRGE